MNRFAVVFVLVTGIAACGALGSEASPGAHGGAVPCRSRVFSGVLPVWARGGFTEPRPRMAHVIGHSGAIAALIFGYPLHAPPLPPPRQNKILWVSRSPSTGGSSLRIRAQRMVGTQRTGRPAIRVIRGGPRPSVIDLPAAGCWRLSLTWGTHRDELDLLYRRAV